MCLEKNQPAGAVATMHPPCIAPRHAFALLLSVLVSISATESIAATLPGGRITATLTNGRTLTAEVDPQTDLNTLWLRWGRKGMLIQQPVSWDQVAEIAVGQQRMAAAEFLRSLAPAPPKPDPIADAAPGRDIVIGSWSRREDVAAGLSATPLPPTATASPQPGRVQSLAIDAWLSHWNSTGETDGLVIEVTPLDAAGFLTPVRGTLEVELTGCKSTNVRPGRLFPVLGRWVHQVEANDFTSRRATYPLAYQQFRPDADLLLSPLATLRARLTVPGQGVFDATATVRIRQATAIRDRL